jgi:hypothetical protein
VVDFLLMKNRVVLQGWIEHRGKLWAAALAMAGALVLIGPPGSAEAAKPVGKDGVVSACYKASGKGKGAVRLVARKQRCKRGERKVAWSVTGPAGSSGASGEQGATGAQGLVGPAGPQGGSGLQTQVSELTQEVEVLKQTLQGVTNESLTDALAAVTTLESTVTGLDSTVSTLGSTVSGLGTTVTGVTGRVDSLCTQTETLTDQVNGVGSSVSSLIDSLLGSLVGAVLGGQPAPPTALPAFACPNG